MGNTRLADLKRQLRLQAAQAQQLAQAAANGSRVAEDDSKVCVCVLIRSDCDQE